MFLRFAAIGSAAWLGLVAAVSPAGAAYSGAQRLAVTRSVTVTAKAAKRAQVGTASRASGSKAVSTGVRRAITPSVSSGPATHRNAVNAAAAAAIRANTDRAFMPTKRTSATAKVAVSKGQLLPDGVVASLNSKGVVAYTHGGTEGIDENQTPDNGTWDDVEPILYPNRSSYAWAANPGKDTYPPKPPAAADNSDKVAPFGQQEPSCLVGVNDFHLYYNGNLLYVGLSDTEKGEQFEPSIGADGLLAFSAYLAPNNDVYKPDVKKSDGSYGAPDYAGLPVRVICTSDNALSAGSGASITKILQPGQLDEPLSYAEPASGDTTGGTTTLYDDAAASLVPALIPDASPAVWPGNSRYVVFVSLRGYSVDDASTHYTSLWLWDTSKDADAAGYVKKLLSVPGKSILFPRFSSDGKKIVFTEADVSFDADAAKHSYIPDPVFDFDVTKTQLQKAFKSRVFVSDFSLTQPTEDAGIATVDDLVPDQVSNYKDESGNEPRDLMPFFTDLGQIGFSSDRVDNDGNGFADAVQMDPTQAKFDVYLFRFPYVKGMNDETLPDTSALRQTLGNLMKPIDPNNPEAGTVHFDDSNELRGCAGASDYSAGITNLMSPTLYYQADDAFPKTPSVNNHGWDIWKTHRGSPIGPSGSQSLRGDILIGLPVVTADPNLTADDLAGMAQTHRKGLPSDYVTISVQLNPKYAGFDLVTGQIANKVAAVVKDPDNRIFKKPVYSEVNNGIVVPVWKEYDCQPVQFGLTDMKDFTAKFGNASDAPQFCSIVELSPVGTITDTSKPIWFSGKFFTPHEVSDYLLDVIVGLVNADGTEGNALVSDNIGGFSTAPFVPSSRVLVVSDFMAGQKSMDETTNVYTASEAACESYVTDNPKHPDTSRDTSGSSSLRVCSTWFPYTSPWATFGPRIEWQTAPTLTIDPATGRLVSGTDGVLNANDPLAVESLCYNEYDLWRVQCREPITTDDVKTNGVTTSWGVLHNYEPYTHTQPGYTTTTNLRTQRVADRCVFWFAPHCGDLNGNAGQNATQVGTIANTSTQTELLNFVNNGGRLALAGTNVAFVLSQGSTSTRNPLLTRMKVAYQSDGDRDEVTVPAGQRTETTAARSGELLGMNPIPYEIWAPMWDNFGLLSDMPSDLQFNSPIYVRDHDTYEDASWSNYHMDGLTTIGEGTTGGAERVYNYTSADTANLAAAVSTHTPTSASVNTSFSKTYFMAFNPDAINRRYRNKTYNGYNFTLAQNAGAMMLHNTVEFFTTGGFKGQVFITNNVASPKNVLVYAVDDWNSEASGQIRGTALTDENGNYSIDGIDPSIYLIYAYKPGFTMQHLVRDAVVTMGSGYTTDNLTLVPTQPGSISGTVYEKGTSPHQVITGVPVSVADISGTISQSVTTGSDGKYSFTSIPTGTYIVTTPEGNYTLVVSATQTETHDYASSSNASNPLTISSGTNNIFDIALSRQAVAPTPGTLVVTVTDASVPPTVPAAGAVVSVLDSTTGLVVTTLDGSDNPQTTAVTGDSNDGKATFLLKAGQYKVQVAYTSSTKTYKTQVKSVLVQAGDATNPTTVTFEFGGVLHTFTGNSILLASLPYDYTGSTASPTTFGTLFGFTDAQLSNAIVAYNPAASAFVSYPNYPSDTARLGRGYGFKLPADGRVQEQGNLVTGSTAVVRTEIGWNLIGDPFPDEVLWSGTGSNSVKVALRSNPDVTMTVDDAKTKGYILSDLWGGTSEDANGNSVYSGTYQVATGTVVLKPWQACWVKVAQPLLFFVPQPVATAAIKASSIGTQSSVLLPVADAWGMNITATGGGLEDKALALGLSTRATDGIDAGLDLAKPTPMGAGNYLYTAFSFGRSGIYATDVRGLGVKTWTFTVTSTLVNKPIGLTWTTRGILPVGYIATLIDTAAGTKIDMSAAKQYTFQSGRNGGVRTFRVEVRRSTASR